MLIGLVKDSVLRCFCHTCSVNTAITGELKKPLAKKAKKPRCKQPKRQRQYHAATEIRCEEKSRGGMCYEVILAEPIADKPEQNGSSPRPKQVTAEDINMKLLQAEERRKSHEATRLASISERLAKLEEASKKREKANMDFIAASHLALEDKLELSSSNRDAYLDALKAKVSDHLTNVESVRSNLESQSRELKTAIEMKLKSAEENRDENFRKLMDKLKEHDEHSQKVRLGHEEAILKLKDRIESKLVMAEANRMSEKLKKLEMLREHSSKVSETQEAKQKLEYELQKQKEEKISAYQERIRRISEGKEAKRLEITKQVSAKIEQALETKAKEEQKLKQETLVKLEHKLETADKNRTEVLEKVKKSQEENDRRAEIVRANKEQILATNKPETASSG